MKWKDVLCKYVDKRDAECPVLDAFVEKKWELEVKKWELGVKKSKPKEPRPYKEAYIKNLEKCRWSPVERKVLKSYKGLHTKEEWMAAWRNQYWHLFVSWFAMQWGANFERKPGNPKCTELCIWLYEAQGLFLGKEKEMIAVVDKIDGLGGKKEEYWKSEIFKAAGIEKVSWADIGERASWDKKDAR